MGEDPEIEAWRNVDPSDPQAVARALAALGARAGAKLAVVEHMHARIGRAVAAVEEASSKLDQLATRQELEDKVNALEQNVAEARRRDRDQSRRRFVGIVLTFMLFAAIVASAVVLNRLDIQRQAKEDERFARRSEAVAICASSFPGDEAAIRECVAARLPSNP